MKRLELSMKDLMKAGVHFGHNQKRWNPKMKRFLYGVQSNTHIIDLDQTYHLMSKALIAVRNVVSRGGRILFVGTKLQSQEIVKRFATSCGQYYVNYRWLGGTLTNWHTVSASIGTLVDLEKKIEDLKDVISKKEMLALEKKKQALSLVLSGIRSMGGVPDIVFVVDVNKDRIAVNESVKLGIPVIGILDSNSNPDGVQYPIPGNDDSVKAIELYCEMIAGATLEGIQKQVQNAEEDKESEGKKKQETRQGRRFSGRSVRYDRTQYSHLNKSTGFRKSESGDITKKVIEATKTHENDIKVEKEQTESKSKTAANVVENKTKAAGEKKETKTAGEKKETKKAGEKKETKKTGEKK